MCETERQAKMELIEFDRFVEQDDCDKYNMLQQSACEIRALENKNKQLKEIIEKISNNILNETTTFCEYCASKDCCPEEDCVLYRIEKLVDKDSDK